VVVAGFVGTNFPMPGRGDFTSAGSGAPGCASEAKRHWVTYFEVNVAERI
jgi:hypothetical protein